MAKRKTLTVSGILADKVERAQTLRKEIAGLKSHRDALALALAATAPVQRLADSCWASPEFYAWDSAVSLSIHARVKVDSLKGPEMGAILAAAESIEGLEAKATEDYASENYADRTFVYRGMVGACSVRLRIEASLPIDGPACRRVQVGVEVREVAKYAIACD
jgi:hypothetical protein